MANTTNYNWETPDDTDLVKDGAAAIRTLGNSIDTTTKNLNPETTTGDIAYRSATANTNTRLAIGTTGQVLTVAAGVPSWATPTDQTPLTTKGDVFTFSTVDARLGVGANGTVLTADSAETTGLKWAAPSAGAVVQVKSVTKTSVFTTTSTSFTDVTGLSVSITPTSASNKILVMVSFMLSANSGAGYPMTRILRDSTAIYVGDTAGNRTPTFAITNLFGTDSRNSSNPSAQFVDTPATTSAITYKLQALNSAGNTTRIGAGGDDDNVTSSARGAASIVVMEVTP